MKESEKIILNLLGKSLFGYEYALPEQVDWKDVYNEANEQTVSLLLYDVISRKDREFMMAQLQADWYNNVVKIMWLNERLVQSQLEILELLEERGIPCVILKGSSSAFNYPKPHLRVGGDIDLLVNVKHQVETVEILQSIGYGKVMNERHNFHLSVLRSGVIVEVHKEPNGISGIQDETLKAKIQAFFADAIEACQCVEGLPVLSDKHQAVALILHKLDHFLNGGFGLRQLCDWAMFVDKQVTETLWNDLQPCLEEFGLLNFTGIITRACVDYLHLPKERAAWAMEYDEDLAREVIERILQQGNFGRKESTYGQRLFLDAHSSNRFTSFVKVFASTCKSHWPICKKYPILMPIAPFVIFGKYLKMHREGKRPKLALFSLYKQAGPKQRLYRELKPFVVSGNEE